MATQIKNPPVRRLGAALAISLLLLFAALALSDGAAAAKKPGKKATASKVVKGKKRKGKGTKQAPTTAPVSSGGSSSAPASTSDVSTAKPVGAHPSTPAPPATTAPAPSTNSPVVYAPAEAPTSPVVPTTPTTPPSTPKTPTTPKPPTTPTPPSTGSEACSASTGATVSAGLGTFSAMVRPTSCWRPYASTSPFNTAVPTGAPAKSGSSAQISRLLSGGALNYFVAGDPNRDWGTAVYYSHSTDPTYTIHCTEPWGRCALEGQVVHLPNGATPSGPWPIGNGDADSHLTVVDQESGWEYDLWNVREIGNGKIVTRWGGKTQIEGTGLGSDAVAAQFGSLAGMIRPAEMKAGRINHALALTIPCTVGYVAPATKGGMECSEAGMSTANALPMGAHLQLRMSSAEIEALNAPAWKKGILRAFSTYGAYVEDTTGAASQWCLKFESANGSTSQGGSDEYVDLAKSLGMTPEDYNGNGYPEYWFDVAGGVDWTKLQVVS